VRAATTLCSLAALPNVAVQVQTPETHGQFIAAARLVGVSDSASDKRFLGKDCRDRLADLDTGFPIDYHAPAPAPALFTR